MYYVYILFCKENDIYYVGHSENPWQRVVRHNEQSTDTFTGKYVNWELAAIFEAGTTRASAMKLEKYIKAQKSRRLLEKLCTLNFVPEGKLAQLVRVPQVRD